MPPSKSVSKKNPSLVQGLIAEAGQRLPQYKKHIDTVGPFIVKVTDVVDASYPYVVLFWNKMQDIWLMAKPYHPEQYGPLFLGLAMCFFGGSYAMIIAAIEAVRLSVWDRLWTSFKILFDNYKIAESASRKDDEIDADGNGVADVLEISDKDLLTRKAFLFARTVDPNQIYESTANITGAFMAVIATLKIQFAQAITLGTSLGELAETHLTPTTGPLIEKVVPRELQRWCAPLNTFLFRSTGVVIAWLLSRVIVGFHAAMRGSNMFVANAVALAQERGFLDANFDANGPKASGLTMLLAFLGFYWQLSNGFSVPFPLNIFLLPVSIAEWWLEIAVSLA